MKRSWLRLARPWIALVAAGLLAGCMNVVFSPDGKSVAFPWGDKEGRIAVMNVDGTGFRWLPKMKEFNPIDWSPDGRFLLVGTTPGGLNNMDELALVDLRKNTSRRLFRNATSQAVWTDDPNRIVAVRQIEPPDITGFVGDPPSAKAEFVWFDAASGKTEFSVKPKAIDASAVSEMSWLPASDGVAFLANDDVFAILQGETIRISHSKDVIGLTVDRRGRFLTWARTSKNPKYILLSLYRYDLDRRTVEKLPFPSRIQSINPTPKKGPEKVDLVRFSPDLSEMAVVTSSSSEGRQSIVKESWEIHRMKLDGSSVQLVARYSDKEKGSPLAVNWSPVGGILGILDGEDKEVRVFVHTRQKGMRVLKRERSKSK